MKVALAALAAASSVLAYRQAATSSIKIMPLGDSITQWQCNNESQGGWRNYLGDSVHGAGFPFVFVGSQYDCGNHEGHSGWTAAQLNELAPSVIPVYAPDIILLQVGTNDLFFNQNPTNTSNPPVGADPAGTVARISNLTATIYSFLPKATLLVSGITYINATRCANYSQAPWHPLNCPPQMQPWIEQTNAMLPAMVASWASKGYSISFHDPNPVCNFVAEDYWTWGIHFTESGYTKIAAAWWTVLEPVLKAWPQQ